MNDQKSIVGKLHILYKNYSGKVTRFFVAGGSAAGTNLAIFYLLTSVMGFYYVWSSIIAFIISFFVSFTLQKFWTFRDESLSGLNTQLAKYISVALFNLAVNTAMLYLLVEYAHFHHLSAQLFTILTIAIWSFFIYHVVIFKRPLPVI